MTEITLSVRVSGASYFVIIPLIAVSPVPHILVFWITFGISGMLFFIELVGRADQQVKLPVFTKKAAITIAAGRWSTTEEIIKCTLCIDKKH